MQQRNNTSQHAVGPQRLILAKKQTNKQKNKTKNKTNQFSGEASVNRIV